MARCEHGVELRDVCESCTESVDVRAFVLFPLNLAANMIVSPAPVIGFRLATEEEIARGEGIFWLWQ